MPNVKSIPIHSVEVDLRRRIVKFLIELSQCMPEHLNPAAKAMIDKKRAEEAKKLLEQKRAEQKLADQKSAEQRLESQMVAAQKRSEETVARQTFAKECLFNKKLFETESVQTTNPKKSSDQKSSGQKPSYHKSQPASATNFLLPLLDKNIRIYMINNTTPIEGKLERFNLYEIKVVTPNTKLILMKHSISFIEILEPET